MSEERKWAVYRHGDELRTAWRVCASHAEAARLADWLAAVHYEWGFYVAEWRSPEMVVDQQ